MKYVYMFGGSYTEGGAKQQNILGGKGANLAEMSKLKIPVPPGFTILTTVCNQYLENNRLKRPIIKQIKTALNKIEAIMGSKFGDEKAPLLVSVRSGARVSMPGMMETVLNIGLTKKTIPGLIEKTNNPRFVYDSYRRLIMMYADVVMEKESGNNEENKDGIRLDLETIMYEMKKSKNIKNDFELDVDDLKILIEKFKSKIKIKLGREFPDSCDKQLWGAIKAVFCSWNGARAKHYRKIENIPNKWGTAVNVQSMVFGNLGENSATGVAFTRNPSNGNNTLYGEWLENAQGEDVVAGIRTPWPINEDSKMSSQKGNLLSKVHPKLYSDLLKIKKILEKKYRDMQDIEFTIENNNLWLLQTRTGKRTGQAAIKIGLDMVKEKLITQSKALTRITPKNIDEIMHPQINPSEEEGLSPIAIGLPASPGGACGQIVFSANDAEKWNKKNKKVLLVRHETSPEDVQGMHVSQGILTAKGGMTSHAALVARGWGKACIVGCSALQIDSKKKRLTVNDKIYKEGDWLTLNSTKGMIYDKRMKLVQFNFQDNIHFKQLMKLSNTVKKLNIRANADNKKDALIAKALGAKGIGLCRTEHMFFEKSRIRSVQKMILTKNKNVRKKAIMELLPYQKKDFYEILKVMSPNPVTIRLLDPPLHEFLPSQKNKQLIAELAEYMGITTQSVINRIISLFEINPMLGHRGCRLAISYPEITEMQTKAIVQASIKLIKEGFKPKPEIMIPLVGSVTEFLHQANLIKKIIGEIENKNEMTINYQVGTMIELPRACLIADEIAKHADFFSFGTNDLTQTTYGFSRDDIGRFIQIYFDQNILKFDPFKTIDQEGVGKLIKEGVNRGRKQKENIKIGICGEHGGDPQSIDFCNGIGMDYVSCSPFRIPIANLSAAQAELKIKK